MRRQEEAIRIMDALSGVDEELLERCEAAGREDTEAAGEEAARPAGAKKLRRIPARRYLGSCAAALALAAAGAVSWRAFWLSGDKAAGESVRGGGSETLMMDFASAADSVPEAEPNPGIKQQLKSESFLDKEVSLRDHFDGTQSAGGDEGFGSMGSVSGAPVMVPEMTGNTCMEDKKQNTSDTQEADRVIVQEECFLLTAEEARQVEILGDYVPTRLPAGYVFESARYMPGTGQADGSGEQGSLTLLWSRGEDDIMLSIRQADGAVGTADIKKPQTYDERLYEIPFGDTVPEEYREIFSDPVFAKDDFSLEIVNSRVISYNGDSGDTSTPRGHFSVLYDDVLVRFNGGGMPEEIWEMFGSIAE